MQPYTLVQCNHAFWTATAYASVPVCLKRWGYCHQDEVTPPVDPSTNGCQDSEPVRMTTSVDHGRVFESEWLILKEQVKLITMAKIDGLLLSITFSQDFLIHTFPLSSTAPIVCGRPDHCQPPLLDCQNFEVWSTKGHRDTCKIGYNL